MTKRDKKGKAIITNASTDTESGTEGLSYEQSIEKDIKTLRIMYEKGLVTEKEYRKRLEELKI